MNLRRFSKDHFLPGFAITAVLAGGCSATPPAALIEAQTSYRQAEQSPNMTGNAAVALHDAQKTLADAEQVWEKDEDRDEVEHLAYVTKQQVEIARAVAERNLTEREIERLSAERARCRESRRAGLPTRDDSHAVHGHQRSPCFSTSPSSETASISTGQI